MPKSRGRKPKKKRAPASARKKRLDNLNGTPQELPLSTQPRATAVGDGATPRAAHTKNKTDREAYNGCCPCGHRHSAVCLCVYIDETMRGDSVNGGPGLVTTPTASSATISRLAAASPFEQSVAGGLG